MELVVLDKDYHLSFPFAGGDFLFGTEFATEAKAPKLEIVNLGPDSFCGPRIINLGIF